MKTETVTMERERLSVRLIKNPDGSVGVIIMMRSTDEAVEVARGTYLDAHAMAVKVRDGLMAAGADVGAGIWWED